MVMSGWVCDCGIINPLNIKDCLVCGEIGENKDISDTEEYF